jgi:hypothetical protein
MNTPLPRVQSLCSRRIVAPLLGQDASFQDRLDWLAGEIGDQLAEAHGPLSRISGRGRGVRALQGQQDGTAPSPQPSPADAGEGASGGALALLCTTTLSKRVSGCGSTMRRLFDRLQARSGLRPAGLLEGYQCAGWGYALRFAATHTRRRRLLLSIVDADLHDIMGTGYEDAVGAIGFGVTTVALELPAGTQVPLCAGPFPNHGFTDLLHAVRAHQKRSGPQPLFMPFLPDGLAGIARRMLGESLGPNHHAHYGHSFGSDPWIGLAEWLRAQPPAADQPVTLGAFAYDGYYTVGSVCVGPWTQVELRADCRAAAPAEALP